MTQMSIPSYKNDLDFTKLLNAVGAEKELPEIRAMIMQNIWSLDFTPPSKIITKVMPNSKADTATTEAFIGQFLALHNQLADHQDSLNPFRLFKFNKTETYAELLRKIRHRQIELQTLMPLFDEDKNSLYLHEQHKRSLVLLTNIQDCINDIRSLLDSLDDKFEDIAQLPAADQEMTRIEKSIEDNFNELGQIFKEERKARMFMTDVMGNTTGSDDYDGISEEKTGRNDPCPCGSGKKYKKCCLH